MKKLAILFLLGSSMSCMKESVDTMDSALGIEGKKLVALTANNKPNLKLEYNKDLLVKENSFMVCETNPTDEFTYQYSNGRISKLITTTRSFYSSTAALCDPASGIKSEEVFEYNSMGQLARVIRANSTSEFTYNTKGQVEKQTIVSNGKSVITTFEYDTKGNLVKDTDADGVSTYYTYDDKINPYYKINQRPQWISPFNKSPNNVIKATGRSNFERSFKYDKEGYPTEVHEDNGVTYIYEYQL